MAQCFVDQFINIRGRLQWKLKNRYELSDYATNCPVVGQASKTNEKHAVQPLVFDVDKKCSDRMTKMQGYGNMAKRGLNAEFKVNERYLYLPISRIILCVKNWSYPQCKLLKEKRKIFLSLLKNCVFVNPTFWLLKNRNEKSRY